MTKKLFDDMPPMTASRLQKYAENVFDGVTNPRCDTESLLELSTWITEYMTNLEATKQVLATIQYHLNNITKGETSGV